MDKVDSPTHHPQKPSAGQMINLERPKEKVPATEEDRKKQPDHPDAFSAVRPAVPAGVTRAGALSRPGVLTIADPRTGAAGHKGGSAEKLLEANPDLVTARAGAFAANEPFFFVAHRQGNQSAEPKVEVGSVFYQRVDVSGSAREKRAGEVFYVSRREALPRRVGTVEEIEGTTNPLAHHLLMVNDDVFLAGSYDPAEHEESLAAASVLFDLGKGVEKSPATAILLLNRLPKERRFEIFGSVFVEALEEKDLAVARACLAYGGAISTVDRQGRDALTALTAPGMEELLDEVCRRTAMVTDLTTLQEARDQLGADGTAGIREVLERHISRLRDPTSGGT